MRILLSILLALLLTPGYSGVPQTPQLGPVARFSVTPVVFSRDDPSRQTSGRLKWLGGVSLTSADPAFGGFSSLRVDGDHVTLLSDGGNIVGFDLDHDWRVTNPSFANLPDGPGTGWQRRDRDSESMTTDPTTGQIWVGFEYHNAIWRYSAGFDHAERRVRPPQMRGWPNNGGAEAMVRLRSGAFVVISETGHWRGRKGRAAIWFDRDPTQDVRSGFRFTYQPPPHYDPSDATELPNGDLLVLNRRFSLPFSFSAILTIVDRAKIRPGVTVTGRPIATLAPPLIHDNFEGVAVTREGSATIVWIASDDNQSLLERSLLLKFRLDPPAPKPSGAR